MEPCARLSNLAHPSPEQPPRSRNLGVPAPKTRGGVAAGVLGGAGVLAYWRGWRGWRTGRAGVRREYGTVACFSAPRTARRAEARRRVRKARRVARSELARYRCIKRPRPRPRPPTSPSAVVTTERLALIKSAVQRQHGSYHVVSKKNKYRKFLYFALFVRSPGSERARPNQSGTSDRRKFRENQSPIPFPFRDKATPTSLSQL